MNSKVLHTSELNTQSHQSHDMGVNVDSTIYNSANINISNNPKPPKFDMDEFRQEMRRMDEAFENHPAKAYYARVLKELADM